MTVDHLATADVVHLCFQPPDAPGSYNVLVGALLHHRGPIEQVAISYSETPPTTPDDRVILVGPAGTSAVAGAGLRLPERVRRVAFDGMGSRERITYALQVAELLARRPPPVVVIWDDYKLGGFLRRNAGLSSTLVLSQHGRSYHLPAATARELYRLDTVDAVITNTLVSYRTDREGLYAYEPLVFIRPNGVDPTRFAPADEAGRAAARDAWALPPSAPVVLSLARLAPSKGGHLLIHSWPRVLDAVPDALLWLVGGGDAAHTERLRAMVERLGLEAHVRFQGPVHRDQVARCHAAADLYVLASVQDEGHPFAVLEAMSSGVACVVGDAPVVRELHSETVELVSDPNVQDAFVDPITRLLGDTEARSALAERGRRQVLERFRLDDYLVETTEFLQRLASCGEHQ